MRYSELVQLYFERSTSLQSYWTLYVVVIGGLLAIASMRQRPDLLTTTLVTILFLCFAYKNIGAIHDVTLQRYAVRELIKTAESEPESARANLDPTLAPDAYPAVRNFHVATDLLTVLTLWAMERRRRRLALASNQGVP
jgi:hypothetical protein